MAKNTDNLDALNKALKQGDYDAAYFENLLKTKSDPQKFIDDYVKKLGDDGKFLDADMETKYTDYLARKAREGKTPRDRADWNHARDYWLNDSPMARGNAFNDIAKQKYDINELNLVLDDGSPYWRAFIKRAVSSFKQPRIRVCNSVIINISLAIIIIYVVYL